METGATEEQFGDALLLFRDGDDRQAHQVSKALLEQAPGHLGGMMLLLATAGACGDDQAINDALLEISEYYEQMLLVPEALELFQSQLLAPVVRSHNFRAIFAPALLHADLRMRDGVDREVASRLIQEATRDAAIEAALANAPLTEAPPVLSGDAIHLVHLETGETMASLRGDRSYRVGRDSKAQLYLNDPFVSRQHLEISRLDGVWVAQSLLPTNPSALNGRSLGLMPTPLRHGDELRVGHVALGIFSGAGEAAAPQDPDERELHVETRLQLDGAPGAPRDGMKGAPDGAEPASRPIRPRA